MEEIATLAGVCASSVVTLLVSDGFGWTKARLLGLFRRGRRNGRTADERDAEQTVERLRRALLEGREAGDETVEGAVEHQLADDFEEFMREDPAFAEHVEEVVRDARRAGPPAAFGANILHYVNHEKLLAAMEAHWSRCAEAEVSAVMFLAGLRGTGRRTTALRWAHSRAGHFATPPLEADLGRNADGAHADPAAVLDGWLAQLAVPPADRPGGLAGKAAAFRAACARVHRDQGPVLVFLFNAETRGQIEPLLPRTPGSAVVITGREAPRHLDGSPDFAPLPVPPLGLDHSVELLARVSGIATEPGRLRPLARNVGGNPWALRIVAGQLRSPDPGVLDDIGDLLAHRDTRQELLDMTDEPSLYATLDLAYDRLAPKSARLYRVLGLLPPGRVQVDTLCALLPAWRTSEVRGALRELKDGSLVERAAQDAYRLEPLVHDHALTRAEQDEEPTEREQLRDRFFAHLLEFVERGEAALSARWLYDPEYVAPRRESAPRAEAARAEGRLARRRDALVPAVLLAHATGRHRHAWRLCQGLWSFYLRTASHTEWIDSHRAGLAAAQVCLDDPLAVARMRFQLGFAHLDRWSLDEDDPRLAREQLEAGLSLVRGAERGEGWRRTESSLLEALGLLALKLRHGTRALDCFTRA
ncbi:hypothetical protein [Streptomyces luteolus]|uniref:NB-ARC domain-containing protein n=1 Tax=Streptomyces luteolus TaxID=3043615 RepID=A0ABT6SPH3_9ACTN|nr:hypothetical protein [Streptomyces sp. B-S-A12]MDI3417514.1 hypothetical protein [Streptomyces sp. B-S-A12]